MAEGGGAVEHVRSLELLLQSQAVQVRGIVTLLRDSTALALAVDRAGNPRPQPVGFELQQFGSRAYRCELPRSDVDVAGTVRQECRNAPGLAKAEIMGRLQTQLGRSQICNAVKKGAYNSTIQFRSGGLRVGFHFAPWTELNRIPACVTTDKIQSMLLELVTEARDCIRLLRDCLNGTEAVSSNSGVRNRLKPIHCALLGIARWKAHGARLCSTGATMQQLVEMCLMFYADFQFETFVVNAHHEEPFIRRPLREQEVVIIGDPADRVGNLGGRGDAAHHRTMRAGLRTRGRPGQRDPADPPSAQSFHWCPPLLLSC